MYYDLKTGKYLAKKESKSLKFLYTNIVGRCILKLLTTKFIANSYAKYLNSNLSKHKIKRFVRKNNIDMSIYEKEDYKSFNDFFIRKIKKNKRPIEDGLISVCDSKLSVYEINKKSIFNIKNSLYTTEELIQDKTKFKYALIYRLEVDDYHHYIFPDKGNVISRKHIKGILHTVQPIAFNSHKVFTENDREITFLQCDNLGLICYVEVGAMLVGKIVNNDLKSFNKGYEKGHFEFGGSTIIVLTQKDLNINKKIIDNTKNGIETIVKLGQNIE